MNAMGVPQPGSGAAIAVTIPIKNPSQPRMGVSFFIAAKIRLFERSRERVRSFYFYLKSCRKS